MNWKTRREIARLQLDVEMLERTVAARAERIKKRIERLKDYVESESQTSICCAADDESVLRRVQELQEGHGGEVHP